LRPDDKSSNWSTFHDGTMNCRPAIINSMYQYSLLCLFDPIVANILHFFFFFNFQKQDCTGTTTPLWSWTKRLATNLYEDTSCPSRATTVCGKRNCARPIR
jgi:hypothetical protein